MKDYSISFWDRIATRYARTAVKDETTYHTKLEKTRTYFSPEMTVLEFGCGTGSTALSHARYVKTIRAYDVSPKMIEIARAKAADQGIDNVEFGCRAIEELECADASYDVVLGLNILHLVGDLRAVIRKIHRLLKPGGVFVSSTLCIADSMALMKYVAPIGSRIGLMPSLTIFSSDKLVESIEECGFDIDYHWKPGKRKAEFIAALKRA